MAKRPPDEIVRGLGIASDKIRALGEEGYGPAEIARFLNIRYQFAYGVLARAHLVGADRNVGEPDAVQGVGEEEVDEAIERTFALERDLQRALREKIEQLEAGLEIVDGGQEKRVVSGLIDITAKDIHGAIVVIELKAGIADAKAVAQILAYMGDLMSDGEQVRGILVASGFAPRTVAAAKAVPNLLLKKYSFQFSFEHL